MTKHFYAENGTCPECGAEFIGSTFVGGNPKGSDKPPQEGDYSLCAICGALMRVGPNGTLLKIDPSKVPDVLRFAQLAAKLRIKELREKTLRSVKASNQTSVESLEKQNPMAAVVFLIALDDKGKIEIAINSEASTKCQQIAATEFIIGMISRGLIEASIAPAEMFETPPGSKPN